ncbi:uncharacterized protein LOC104898605 [Beta vulgaris subsp. vulgaris]|uniref:uncharacterized protein LOC104898605 n=1 Tax=Beta vulgaris subsp. vulgaris TaxID=3555 RepID=UPI002036947A|nr:uncharacterized protein LOC104898605 [Beta vulgaris subsp. vulgaris]
MICCIWSRGKTQRLTTHYTGIHKLGVTKHNLRYISLPLYSFTLTLFIFHSYQYKFSVILKEDDLRGDFFCKTHQNLQGLTRKCQNLLRMCLTRESVMFLQHLRHPIRQATKLSMQLLLHQPNNHIQQFLCTTQDFKDKQISMKVSQAQATQLEQPIYLQLDHCTMEQHNYSKATTIWSFAYFW